ncbi:MAG: CRISPR-associated helicase Cas3' [Ktedonobacteraceae bacterium]|nr:CRISPR-associated helicase Cas3' [Ktedonobacteraceae bacterium]
MKPSRWPDWLATLWAKRSTDKAHPGESLAEHTWLVLSRLAELGRLRPHLATYLGVPRLWQCLFWACFLHDFGKAASGFQSMLRTRERWARRHEVLSLAFLDWIVPAFSSVEQKWVLAAIVSHHRDAHEITSTYDKRANPELVEDMLTQLDEGTVRGLWRWLQECSAAWIDALALHQFAVQPIPLVDEEQAVRMTCVEGVQRTHAWLTSYRHFIEDLDEERDLRIVTTLVMLRGLTTTADHMASAHLKQVPQGIERSWQAFAQEGLKGIAQLYAHQYESAQHHHTSAMLVAPTGSGKTEAALFWALGNGTEATSRLFYTLPYQASMNAMYDRLSSYFGESAVGLQHGRALQALYQRLMQGESGPSSVAQAAQWQHHLTRLHACPVKVLSPYQMLKTVYQIKGFEGMLADYTQAAFIFDEIHAYDANRLALLLALVKHLRDSYGARFFVMSATFPSLLREIMPTILGISEPIMAEQALFAQFKRHHLRLLDGDLLEAGIARIISDVRQGKSVLVCCTTIQRAQDMREALLKQLPPECVELLHSRFTMKDRLEREATIRARCAVDAAHTALAVVATQVVEVSLNIDVDTIYSDPAPLDALVQRFGRVNRARKKHIVPVHVFRQPRDGQKVYLEALVQRTLDVLEAHNEEDIDEAALGAWLDEIYAAPEIHDPWMKTYTDQFRLVASHLRGLRPFNSDAQREAAFEELFDGVEVLPRCFEEQYLEHMAHDAFIDASRLFVNISHGRYQQLASCGKVRPLGDAMRKRCVVLQTYSSELGLLFDTPSGKRSDDDQ